VGSEKNATPVTNTSLQNRIKTLPLIGLAAKRLARFPIVMRARRLAFSGSASFWEKAYREGSMSKVCPGSYGRLAEFKAEVLNDFVRQQGIGRVIEFGCGDGSQLQLFDYPEYVGVDVSGSAVACCKSRFANDPSKSFYVTDAFSEDLGPFDLALSLDVIYHLVEDDIFESYMKRLFQSSRQHVAVYASDYDAWTEGLHVRHRKFTTWVENNAPEWRRNGFVANRFPFDPTRPDDTSCADFHFFVRDTKNTNALRTGRDDMARAALPLM